MGVLGFALAIVMGAVLGLTGGGGSILTVPILTYIFYLDAPHATAYSLFVVGVASALAAWDYHKRKMIAFKTGIYFATPALISVYSMRRFVIPMIPEQLGQFGGLEWTRDSLILVAFAIVMLIASVMMIKGRSAKCVEQKHPSPMIVIISGLLIGALTGFVGAGGGFLIVPALVFLTGLDMKVAVGTSLFIITINSLLGFVGDIQSMLDIDWLFLAMFTALAMGGIVIGTKFSRKVDSQSLKKAFGWFVLIMGTLMLGKELWG